MEIDNEPDRHKSMTYHQGIFTEEIVQAAIDSVSNRLAPEIVKELHETNETHGE